MNHLSFKMPVAGVLAVSMAMLTGCVDDKYDLSDIDTNVAVTVDNLTIPVNLDVIRLSSIISLDDDSRIKIINGEYAITEEGQFESDPIKIASFSADAPVISPIEEYIDLTTANAAPVSRASQNLTFNFGGFYSDYYYQASGIDGYIVDITSADVDMTMKMKLRISAADIKSYRFKRLVLQFPQGLTATPSVGTYDAATGLLNITDLTPVNGVAEVSLAVKKLTFGNENIRFDGEKHEFEFDGEVGIKDCDVEVVETTGIPASANLYIDFNFSRVDVDAVSGIIDYSLDGMAIDPVSLNNLPDFLSQNTTNIILSNPQIYISLTNPLAGYHLTAQAGLMITPERNGVAGQSARLDNGVFEIDATAGEIKYCMSPSRPSAMPSGFESATYVGYKELSDVLSGAGLPQQLDIEIVDACVPRQSVSDFKLGVDVSGVVGKYKLLAPLALEKNSQIVYTETENGWNDETLDDLVVTDLTLTFTVSTDVPMGVSITGYPIDINGHQINGVEIEGATLNANADGQEVTVHMKGEITGLDGITFTAVTSSPADTAPLRPDQTIDLKNIHVTVSGYYSKEL